jgi:hypothetical protein
MRICNQNYRFLLLFLAFTFTPSFSSAKNTKKSTGITPTDNYNEVERILAELEILRQYMGKPKNNQKPMIVQHATPQQVYFQALTLYKKSERLGFEQIARHSTAPTLPEGKITPSDVYALITAGLERITAIKHGLDITESAKKITLVKNKTPSDVFGLLIQANRQLNLLLGTPFCSSEVYQEVTRALNYVKATLKSFPNAKYPEQPSFQAKKDPTDVMKVLLQIQTRLSNIEKKTNAHGEGLSLEYKLEEHQEATPSDIYPLASLVLAESKVLHSKLSLPKKPEPSDYSGKKLPSDVHQRARELLLHVNELEHLTAKYPNWYINF